MDNPKDLAIKGKGSKSNYEKMMKYRHDNYLKEGTDLVQLTKVMKNENTSGVKGVCFRKGEQKFVAQMEFKGEVVLYKRFDNLQDAINARKEAEDKYFKPILEKYNHEVSE